MPALVLVAMKLAKPPTGHGYIYKAFMMLGPFFVDSTKASGIFKPSKSALCHPWPERNDKAIS
jgi:hypothetical protein